MHRSARPLWLAVVLVATPARSADNDALILPTVTPLNECATCPDPRQPLPNEALSAPADLLDTILSESAQDLGLSPAPPEVTNPERLSETALVALARRRWVFSPRIEQRGGRLFLRIVAIPVGSSVLLSRTEQIAQDEIEERAPLMMRDLVRAARSPQNGGPASSRPPATTPGAEVAEEARSPGRAILGLNGAALGGYLGYSLQHAGGSDDARLTYPLIALGTGIGLGGSMIVAEEWDVGIGDAWYLAAGTFWPALGVFLVAEEASDRYVHTYALTAGLGGLAVSATALGFGGMSDGGAILTHSGGAYGTLLGGLGQLLVEGETTETPRRGLGVGAISGVVVAGAAARWVPAPSPSRVLMLDLGLGLGALTGAAVASPFLFGDTEDELHTRLWLGSVGVGMVAGGVLAYAVTDSASDHRVPPTQTTWWPEAGVIGLGDHGPLYGAGVRGIF